MIRRSLKSVSRPLHHPEKPVLLNLEPFEVVKVRCGSALEYDPYSYNTPGMRATRHLPAARMRNLTQWMTPPHGSFKTKNASNCRRFN
ncbi:hypothetical protein E2C01_072908 [Portunus trituberculatus]|uniref:Uncharacterized protein n=1 Tax=Portunus trituberculatus TaxID=210409 RepID=A0A5B7I3T4_PORTR|nr:hypothetical protein [Portunus trituberculatus]